MEKNGKTVLMRVLLSVGIVFFGINSVFFYINNPNSFIKISLIIGLSMQFIIGMIVLLLKVEKKAYQFFIALIFIGWSILNGLIAFVLPFDVNILWPLYLIAVSIFLFISGYRKYKKVKLGYAMPSFTLLCMGIVFSLFSFDIIKVPFKAVAIVLGPIMVVISILSLVSFFMLQQHYEEFVIKDEDSGDFSDEELSFPKID